MQRRKDQTSDSVSLREYVEAMFAEKEKALQAALSAQEKAVAAALEASDKAITKGEINAEKWRESANEWRGAMSDRDRELPSRREVESLISALDSRLVAVESWQQHARGKTEGVGLSTGVVVGGLMAVAAVISAVVVIANLVTG